MATSKLIKFSNISDATREIEVEMAQAVNLCTLPGCRWKLNEKYIFEDGTIKVKPKPKKQDS